MIFINYLSGSQGLFGRSTREVSDMFHVNVTPAGYAFLIWSAIYILLAGFVIVQALPSKQDNAVIRNIGPWFILSCLFNGTWIFAWHSVNMGLSTLLIVGLLLTLIVLYIKTRPAASDSDRVNRWLIALPFSIYMGWISVASIVNLTIFFSEAGFNGFGLSGEVWAILLFIIAALLAVFIGIRFNDPYYGLVIVWALIAIGVEQQETVPSVTYGAWIVSAFILIFELIIMAKVVRSTR
ncbi:hypothetical protein SY83_01090 [Paenibacillus swuensis]|uniref:Tryptophan-rich sensory protein n=2 Tax=Paenibacillus swuensis TaxID=1178515 RepID=A0A172TNS5_9BACL|nr:hypothetical protein SY83_01090 [Paenibacillus swuensis]